MKYINMLFAVISFLRWFGNNFFTNNNAVQAKVNGKINDTKQKALDAIDKHELGLHAKLASADSLRSKANAINSDLPK